MPRFTLKMNVFPSISCAIAINVCWNPQNRACFSMRWSIWGVTCLGLLKKWTFFHLSPWKQHTCMLKPSEQGSFFWDNWFEGSHAKVYPKNEHFLIYLMCNCQKCVLKPSEQGSFLSKTIDLRGHMPRFTLKMNIFSSISLRIASIHVCWNPQNKAHCFYETIDLRGHMPRFTLKMSMFSHLSPWKQHTCVLKPSEQGSFFWDNWFEGSHAKVYSKNEHFLIYLMRIARNVCWNPQNRAHFYETIDLRGHMPRFTLKMNIFPSISVETTYMCVETLRTGLVFPRWSIWGVTC